MSERRSDRSGRWAAVVLSCLVGAASLAGAAHAGTEFEARLDAALRHPGLRGATLAVCVVEQGSGRPLYARQADRALVPASNQKILTALAALAAWGPAHRFETRVLADAAPDAGGAVQDLYVVGGGDPALTSEELWRLATELRARGLRRVRGDLVVDASLFDDERWHPEWGEVSARAYHAPVAAFNANYGAYGLDVAASTSAGEALRVALDPEVSYLRIVNRARSTARGASAGLQVERRAAGGVEEVLVGGSLAAGSEAQTVYRSVLDPVAYAAAVLLRQLEYQGIRVGGGYRRGAVPAGAVPLHVFEGRPLAEIVRLLMKFSNNLIGETLVKQLAVHGGQRPGNWAGGVAALRRELETLGLDLQSAQIADGSGLSYANHVSPRLLVAALERGAADFRFGPDLVASLPIAAEDGTLARRASGAAERLRAKTGLLTQVSALSGYARLADGSSAVFSVLANGFRGSADAAMAGMDAFAAALVTAPVGAERERLR